MSAELLGMIRAYLRRTGSSPAAFAKAATNNGSLIREMELGRVSGPKLTARVLRFIEEHPDGVGAARKAAGPRGRDLSSIGYVDVREVLPQAIGPVPFPPPHRIAEDHGPIASEIAAEAARRGWPIASLLSELVAVGWRTVKDNREFSKREAA